MLHVLTSCEAEVQHRSRLLLDRIHSDQMALVEDNLDNDTVDQLGKKCQHKVTKNM